MRYGRGGPAPSCGRNGQSIALYKYLPDLDVILRACNERPSTVYCMRVQAAGPYSRATSGESSQPL